MNNDFNGKDTLAEYWTDLNFKYLKTYSGFRGNEFERDQHSKKTDVYNSLIIDKEGDLHRSTIEIICKEKTDPFVKKLDLLLSRKCESDIVATCPPIYRDAIVFYTNENAIMGMLHICFYCVAIKDQNGKRLSADGHLFTQLALLLKEVGHPI